MKNRSRAFMGGAHFLLISSFLILFYWALGYVNPGPKVEKIKFISHVTVQVGDQAPQHIKLPHSFQNLPPRTPVTYTATIYPEPDEEILVETQYCPGKVYLNGVLGYEFGSEGQYPAFMLDPAREVHMTETHGTYEAMELKVEFLSPVTQRRMILEAPLLGTTKEIMMQRFKAYGFTCTLAAAQILYGIALLMISVCTQFLDKKGVSFLWLGFLSLLTGVWAMGENNFSHVLFKNSTMLYVLSFGGFFTFIIPLLRFSRAVVDFQNPRPLWYLELIMAACGAAALLLQLFGIVACSTSMHFFYLVLPGSLLFLTGYTIREWIKYRKTSARRFILPIGILSASAVLGLIGYLYSITYTVSSLTQIGIVIFLILMGVIASFSLKDSIYLHNQQKELKFEKSLMDIQAKEQKNHSDLISQQEQMLSQQRHDLRHHLNVLKALASDESQELQDYLDSLMDNIPTASRRFCENQAVNAIVSHYATVCRQKGIELTLDLTIPEGNPGIPDSSLCVIFGNLLENALEACDRLKEEPRFIRLNTKLQYELLVITMDNSFNGIIRKDGSRFQSSKRDDYGIGLSSIQSVARKHGGNATFRGDGKVFLSSIYFNL